MGTERNIQSLQHNNERIRRFEVTQEHIDNGEAGDCYKCALALAFMNEFPKCTVSVNADKIILTHDGVKRTIKPSRAIRDWILCFDTDRELVSPITLLLDEETNVLTKA
jgi:hypothetical protein